MYHQKIFIPGNPYFYYLQDIFDIQKSLFDVNFQELDDKIQIQDLTKLKEIKNSQPFCCPKDGKCTSIQVKLQKSQKCSFDIVQYK